MRVPDIRARLIEIARERAIPEVEALARMLKRRSPARRAPATSRPVTPELAAEIRAYAAAHPTASQTQIGGRFNVNPGRVSEALHGVRK